MALFRWHSNEFYVYHLYRKFFGIGNDLPNAFRRQLDMILESFCQSPNSFLKYNTTVITEYLVFDSEIKLRFSSNYNHI